MIKDLIIETLLLQKQFSHKNTPQMKKRGEIVRSKIPTEISKYIPDINLYTNTYSKPNIKVEGGDGVGSKAGVPWVRLYDSRYSKTAQNGWYVVYLFRKDGKGVYLSLAHGSTTDSALIVRPDSELQQLVSFARTELSDHFKNLAGITQKIQLLSPGRGASYEKSTAFAKYYSISELPSDKDLVRDLMEFMRRLGMLYQALDQGRMPLSPSPEANALEEILSGHRSNGQGRGLTGEQRKAVENHAMIMARRSLKSLGYKVTDVSSNSPYDYKAIKDGKTISVEVKGTTGDASNILLTHNEVEHHRKNFPNNALIIVHGIILKKHDELKTEGGNLEIFLPWKINESNLYATAYSLKSPFTQ